MPKDTQQSMLAYYERKGRAVPAPNEHYKELTWKSKGARFGVKNKNT